MAMRGTDCGGLWVWDKVMKFKESMSRSGYEAGKMRGRDLVSIRYKVIEDEGITGVIPPRLRMSVREKREGDLLEV